MVKGPTQAGAQRRRPRGDQDRRKHKRVDQPLKARALTKDGEELDCVTLNVSAGGGLFRTKSPPKFGERVIVYIESIGRFEGPVVRSGKTSFAVSFESQRRKKIKTSDALTQSVNEDKKTKNRFSGRNSPRINHDAPTQIYLDDGRAQKCSILDISLTGASLEIYPRPPLGTHLILGRMTAKVVRRHEKGVGVVFTGSAERMEDVIKKTASENPHPSPKPPSGAPIAPAFGKKSSNA